MIYFNTQHEEFDEWDLQTDWRFIATSPGKCHQQIRSRFTQDQTNERFLRPHSRQFTNVLLYI